MTDYRQIITDFLRSHHYRCVTPKAALLDMDGTLYDSMGNHADSWARLCREEGIPCERDEFFQYEGRTGASTIDLLIRRSFGRPATDDEKKRLYQKKTEYFNRLPAVGPMPGARQLLDLMRQTGIDRVVVTGSGQASLLDRLCADFPGAFTAERMVTSRNVTHGKPHPEPYIRGLQMACVSPSAAIAVENAPLGVESAAKAGIFTVGLTTGPIPASDLYKAGAAVVYPSMQAFADDFHNLVMALLNTSIEES